MFKIALIGDPSVIDLDSDWKAPTEEWGNWTGDEEHQKRDENKVRRVVLMAKGDLLHWG